MTSFDEAFVDVQAFQPPGKWQARANNLMVWLVAIMLLVAGWFFSDWMMSQFGYLALAQDEPAIPYPVQWLPQPPHDLALQVFAPDSASLFPAREEVAVLPLPDAPLAIAWPKIRQQQLRDYHELEHLLTTLTDGRQALLLTYTHLEETTDIPVVVKAQDLAFVINDGRADRLVVVTLAADAHEWEEMAPAFGRILQKMGVTTP